jgi:hypothetical protein
MKTIFSLPKRALDITTAAIRERWTVRPFPDAELRVLLVYHPHRLARTQFEPFLRYRRRLSQRGVSLRRVSYRNLVKGQGVPRADAIFLQSDYTPAEGEIENVLSRLKNGNPAAVISYFDWFAPLDIRLAERVDQFVDFYVKKALLRDHAEYLRPLEGHTNLSDYYAQRFGTDNPPATWTVPPTILPKLVAGPAFSTGKDLIGSFERGLLPGQSQRPIDVHARIAINGTPWYKCMRQQAADAIDGIKGLKIARAGMVSHRRYLAELKISKIVFSPFGYGEICWRDFEAVAAGAVLLKPDMSHVEANPNIYVPDETYVPVRWDFADLEEKVRELLADQSKREALSKRAYEAVHRHLVDGSVEDLLFTLARRPEQELAA